MSFSSPCVGRRNALRLLALGLGAGRAWAEPTAWPERGRSRMRFLGLSIYDITLAAPQPVRAQSWSTQPLLLTLRYHRRLTGQAIAERSIEEMRRQGPLGDETGWLDSLRETFPDVMEGDRLAGLHEPERGARFWFNGEPLGQQFSPRFSRAFFGIWLAPQTSEPAMRRELLGL